MHFSPGVCELCILKKLEHRRGYTMSACRNIKVSGVDEHQYTFDTKGVWL